MQITAAQGQPVSLQIVMHFVTNQNGDTIGIIDSPTQHVRGIPITEASLDSGKVALKADGVKAEFHGDLARGTITGQWTQGPLTAPLALKKR